MNGNRQSKIPDQVSSEQSVAVSIRKEVIFLGSLLEFLAKHKNLIF